MSGLVGRVFTNGPGELGSIPGRVKPNTSKIVLDTSLLNTQQYKVRIKGTVEQSGERSYIPQHIGVVAIEKGAFWSLSTTVANFTYLLKCQRALFEPLIVMWRQIKIKGSPDEQPFKSVWEMVHLNIVITERGFYFSLLWRWGGLALDPS